MSFTFYYSRTLQPDLPRFDYERLLARETRPLSGQSKVTELPALPKYVSERIPHLVAQQIVTPQVVLSPPETWRQYIKPISADMLESLGTPVQLNLCITKIKCYASEWMTRLLSWRNPRASDEGARWGFGCRMITTQLALPLLSVVAAVETVAYAAKACLRVLITPFARSSPSNAFGLLRSSSTTLLWSITCFAHTNYRTGTLDVEEDAFSTKLSSLFRANVLTKA